MNLAGPKGEKGDKGDTGDSGSSPNLPFFSALEAKIHSGDCQLAKTLAMAENNFPYSDGWADSVYLRDENGKVVDYTSWYRNLVSSYCQLETASELQVQGFGPATYVVSDVEHGAVILADPYSPYSDATVTVTSYKASFQLETGWHLCTVDDEQISSLVGSGKTYSSTANFNAKQSLFTQVSPGVYQFSGSASVGADDGSETFFYTQHKLAFCGPDSDTSSGLGYRLVNIQIPKSAFS